MKKHFDDFNKKRKQTFQTFDEKRENLFKNIDKQRKEVFKPSKRNLNTSAKQSQNHQDFLKSLFIYLAVLFLFGIGCLVMLWLLPFLKSTTTSTEPQATISSSQTISSEESSTSISSSSYSTSTSSTVTSTVIATTADDFNRMQNEASLEVGKSYKFTGTLIDKDLWGPDGVGYLIYVNSYDSKRGRNEQLLLNGSKSIANNIKNANEAEFTVKVTEDSYGDYEFDIVSAQPK